ncbi:MAG: hypothetical protein R2789_07670 [Microthrixaceae bacterium]
MLCTLLANEDDRPAPRDDPPRDGLLPARRCAHRPPPSCGYFNNFEWEAAHPEEAGVLRTDPLSVQRCMHETIRLEPSSPVAMRWALDDMELRSGRQIARGRRW